MSMISLGDLAQTFMLRGQTARLKTEINRSTQELSSGLTSDVAARLNGDTTQLAALQRSKSLVEGFQAAAADQETLADAMQSAIANLQELGEGLQSAVITAAQSSDFDVFETVARDAKSRFISAVNGLNVSTAGRFSLSGTQVQKAPLPEGETLFAQVQSVVAGAGTPGEVVQRLTDWFMGPAGYAVSAYGGGDAAGEVSVGRSETFSLPITANDADVRRALQGLAVAAVLDDTSLGLSNDQRRELANMAIEELDAGNVSAINASARIGTAQQQIDRAQSRNSAEALVFESRIAKTIEADPFTLATELEAMQTNLEMVYSITARLSRLHLSDYL